MQRKIGLFLGLVALFGFVAVALQAASPEGAKDAASVSVSKTVSAEIKHLVKTVPPPKIAGKDAIPAEIDILYPVFTPSAEPKSAIQAINKRIQNSLLALQEGKTSDSVEKLIDSFSKEYEEALNKAPELTGGWSLKFAATIRYSDDDLLALQILENLSTGGAHGNPKITYLVFSLKTGEPLALTSFISEKRTKDLNLVAEKAFRQARKLKPNETLNEAGFEFKKEQFAINQNFLVSKEGLAFCFNPCEIGPYSHGITEMVIPWEDLKTIAQPDSLAGRFLSGAH